MKKSFLLSTVTLASVFILSACGGGTDESAQSSESAATESSVETTETTPASGELQDGTYTLTEKNLDDNGWRTEFSITVKGGEITESNYQNLNEAGELKTEDEEYQKAMAEKTGGVGPQQYIPELNEQLVAKQDPSEVEVVTGATHSYESFKVYAQQLVDAAAKGDTKTIEIDN